MAATVKQCSGITKSGRRCTLTSDSKMRNESGCLVAEPLRRGGCLCRFHARPFVARPVEEPPSKAVVLYLDFETTGLDVTRDQIVEIGALEALAGSAFASVVNAAAASRSDGAAVHGIDRAEIAQGPTFPEVWRRFVTFAEELVNTTMADDSESSQDCSPRPCPALPAEPPVLVLAAHNGFRFDFAMLLCECSRHGVSWAPLHRWLFVDTLSVHQATRPSCMKLQCLRREAANGDGLRAHRALDDCFALRATTLHVAERLGLDLWGLLRGFAVALDGEASMAQVSLLLEG